MKREYVNRYGDIFAFTMQPDGNILWEGNFEYCRFGLPNDYTKAYKEYIDDNCNSDHCMSLKQFKEEVHGYDDETHQYVYDKYVRMVESIKDKIDMIDPSGGPYISVGMPLSSFGFEDLIVKDFAVKEKGYLIITEKNNG
jgi:hypothetical protein